MSSSQASTTTNNGENERTSLYEQRIRALNKQLEIEMKIRAGAENMLHTFTQGPKKDKKLSEDAQAMLKDAKLKIEYIKMQLNKVNNQFNNETSSSSLFGQHYRSMEENLCNLRFLYRLFT